MNGSETQVEEKILMESGYVVGHQMFSKEEDGKTLYRVRWAIGTKVVTSNWLESKESALSDVRQAAGF